MQGGESEAEDDAPDGGGRISGRLIGHEHMPKAKVNGIDIHYITVGQGSDMVMVHGFLGNLAVWHLQIVPQLRNSYSITTLDLRGHGYSQVTPSGYTAADMADDLKGLLDTLGLRKVALVGHSYGADVCLYFALLYPERVSKLVAAGAWAGRARP